MMDTNEKSLFNVGDSVYTLASYFGVKIFGVVEEIIYLGGRFRCRVKFNDGGGYTLEERFLRAA
jgi:hypothetical protein